MHRFKVGQEVVAVRDHSQLRFRKGDEFIVESLSCCPKCGASFVMLSSFTQISNVNCKKPKGCDHVILNTRPMFNEFLFAPKQSLSDAIEYRLSVSIKELEVKEYQQQ